MPAAPILSICIPAYNFGAFIGETLDSILAQWRPGLEIVILDGGSIDDTAQVVASRQLACPDIRFVRRPAPGGIDNDLAACVDLAEGIYCWLFSADDVMRPGSIDKVMKEVAGGHDLCLCRHSDCTIDMRVIKDHPILDRTTATTYELRTRASAAAYFAQAVTTEAMFSFMGGIIISRQRWSSLPIDERFVGSCWAHVARILALIDRGLTLRYLDDVLLDRRGDNDSFAHRGVVHRYAIAIDGYTRLAATFYGQVSIEAAEFRRVLRNEFGLRHFLAAKFACKNNPSAEDFGKLRQLMGGLYADAALVVRLKYFAFLVVPVGLYDLARRIRHRISGY